MGTLLSKDDIAFDNHNFWWYYILSFHGFDDEKEFNLDDAIKDVIDEAKYVPDFLNWYRVFCPENSADTNGDDEPPNIISGRIDNGMSFAIEFHPWHTTYYLDDRYIGNLGGHFEAWFLTLDELLGFDNYEFLFLLFLPMAGIEPDERAKAEQLIIDKLQLISIFTGHEAYISKCIVNGLLMDVNFEQTNNVGITCAQNHSVRNIKKYPRYTEDVITLNKKLTAFINRP